MEEKKLNPQPAAETPVPETQPDELHEEKDFRDISSEPISQDTNEPEVQTGELHEKKVFTDIFSEPLPEEADAPVKPNAPEPSFYESITLDIDYAAQNPAAPKAPAVRPPVVPVRRESAPIRREPAPVRPKPNLKRTLSFLKLRLTPLCSGERYREALRRIVRQSCALLLVCLIIGGVLWAKQLVTERMTNNSYESLAKSTVYSEPAACLGFSVESADLPDGYALAQALCTRLGTPITDTSVFEKSAEDTVFPEDVAACMESVLPPDRVVLKENISNLDLLTQMHESISAGNPVLVLLSEADAPELTLRYAAVTRMNVEQNRITVEFPNTGTKTYSFEDFIAATRFENTGKLPYLTKLALNFGVWSPNTAVFVS